ncbi:MAG: divergent PAP2 family protein [bacterium]|nr:divergent PAP2 family protein [bacterium]
MGEWPLWALVGACAVAGQSAKFVLYSAVARRAEPSALFQGYGAPSLPAAVLACLLTLVTIQSGWASSEASFALVLAVVAVHDTVKLRLAATRQREIVHAIVTTEPAAGPLRRRVAGYLDPLSHHPAHVLAGLVFGVLFAVATAPGAR